MSQLTYQIPHRRPATSAPAGEPLLTVGGAARLLGVHANTIRSWTDRGLLGCLRVNGRGDRRYPRRELERFVAASYEPPQLAAATRPTGPASERRDERDAVDLIRRVAEASVAHADPDEVVAEVARVLCTEGGFEAAAHVERDGSVRHIVGRAPVNRRLCSLAAVGGKPVVGRPNRGNGRYSVAIPVGEGGTDGVLLLRARTADRAVIASNVLAAVASLVATSARMRAHGAETTALQRRAKLLIEAQTEIGSELDLQHTLNRLVGQAAEFFSADHAAVFGARPGGGFAALATLNLSADYCHYIEHAPVLPLADAAFHERSVIAVADFPDDPRAIELRPALVREGINTIALAPLVAGSERLGLLSLYHDARRTWTEEERTLLGQFARQGSTVLRNAQSYSQMATWAAQLQSIQQLGARLTRLRSVKEIGQAICTELNQLIDSHNIRVYRVEGEDCAPVAWRGEVGEYSDEDGDQLRVKVGEGITGWVARYGLAQNLGDAAGDRRSKTIPGTEDGLEESLLLAPMLYEDEVIGVIVLAKLGLNQFSADDLRLLEIYASIAAQAMANADATERLRAQSEALARQLSSQRELLRVTESILATLDTQALLEEIAERLGSLLLVDNICVDVHDERAGVLRPIFARGVHSAEYMAATLPDTEGLGGDVMRTGEAVLVQDQTADPRVAHLPASGPLAGALIVAPLRSGSRVQGLLTIERLGADARFSEDEFDLVQLFAAHVAIAFQNAAAHRAVELRAETDSLTGLWNHGTLTSHISGLVEQGGRFALLMVDLDDFKQYNDRLGHQAGNVMLREVAELLRASCRDSDEVFRFGGDEFAVLLPSTAQAGARIVAEKIRAAVEEVSETKRMPVHLTCSIGIAVHPRDGRTPADLILSADRACYAAKRAGRNRIATAVDGLALADDFRPTEPTPADEPEPIYSAA